ncbi:MarR family winged helix-turn-helix transcriptional regulator [Actinomycetospora sp.]|jgi:DNA-binding MarR family transcriptional regulator|uniref:MarR family winged helix-turn-helix transcriptional regulator n=1 Tax=Actinomycetospora sp. TaxID=1872135 RepID=UPI002F418594
MRDDDQRCDDTAPASFRDMTFWRLRRANRLVEQAIHARLESAGLRRPYVYGILATLADAGPASQAEIGRRLGVDPSDMVAALNELESEGRARRERDPDDRRRNLVVLTDVGREVLTEVTAELRIAEDEALGALDPDERATLRDLLGKCAPRAGALRAREHKSAR